LPQNRLFEGLPARDREQAIGSCIRKLFRSGEPVFSVGDSSEFIYILEEGHVRLGWLEGGRVERILNFFKPGDVFGEILFSVGRRPFQAVALDNAKVAIMPKATFAQFLGTSAQWGMNFIRLISDRLATVQEDLAAVLRTRIRSRLIHALLKLAGSLGKLIPEGTLITVPLTHEALAKMVGASRVRVTTTLKQLQREGLILKRGRFLIVRTEALEASLAHPGS
jgi:CRP-like cAMP-binding protein